MEYAKRRAAVILTNLLYAVAGIIVILLGQTMLHAALAIALGLLTGGSWRFHETLKKADLMLDRLGMMFVGATLAGFALHAAAGGDPSWWLIGEISVVSLFAMFITEVNSFKWTGIFAVLALVGAALVAGWWVLLPAGLFAVALLVRLVLDPGDTTWGHAVWHVLVALAVATTVYVMR